MKLSEKQQLFSEMTLQLFAFLLGRGYKFTYGEAYRPPFTAEAYARQGKGIKNSLHCSRLAIDINLFKDGVYLTETKDYEEIGRYWESIGGSWGGRFKRRDGNHFSLEHRGVR